MLRWLAGALVAAVLAAVAVLLVLPRVVTGSFVRDALRAATGGELAYESIELDVFEPKLVLVRPSLSAQPPPDGERFADAARAEMDIALAPLLARVLLVDSARLDGASLRLVRSAAGVRPAGSELPSAQSAPPTGGARFAVRAVDVSNGRLLLEDRTVTPAAAWELRALSGRASGTALDAPVDFAFSGELASGGRIRADGDSTLAGAVDAEITLEDVSLAPAAPYFESSRRVEGLLSGTIDVNPERIKLEWNVRDARLRLGEISLRGALVIEARIRPGAEGARGRVEIDATGARLRYGGFFKKPPGTPAKVTGRVIARPDGTLTIERWKFEMSDFEGFAPSPV